jgi:hypothetical protein
MSFTEVKTINIDLETINGLPFSGSGSHGAEFTVNYADGTGGWKASLFSLDAYALTSSHPRFQMADSVGNTVYGNNTTGVGLSAISGYPVTLSGSTLQIGTGPFDENIGYTLPLGAPAANYQVLSTTGITDGVGDCEWNYPLQTNYSQASIITDLTNASINTQYLISSFNASAVPTAAADQGIPCFQIINGRDYTITTTIYSSSAPLGADSSVQIGLATGQVTDGAGGTLTYTLSNIAASLLTIPVATFSSASGYSTSATFTYAGTTHAICLPYILLSTGSTWNVTKTISFSVNVTQNN